MEKLFNGINWKGLKCSFDEEHQSHISIAYNPKDEKAKEFVAGIIKQCEDFVKNNPLAFKELQKERDVEKGE